MTIQPLEAPRELREKFPLTDAILGRVYARYDAVICAQWDQLELSEGGIIIPESGREERRIGVVLSVGPEVEGLEVGQLIVWPRFAGAPVQVEVDGKKHEYATFKDRDLAFAYAAVDQAPDAQ